MREQMEALLGGQTSRSWSGAIRDVCGRFPEFVFVHDNPKVEGMKRYCERRRMRKRWQGKEDK